MDCQAGTRKQTSGYPGDIIQGWARRAKREMAGVPIFRYWMDRYMAILESISHKESVYFICKICV